MKQITTMFVSFDRRKYLVSVLNDGLFEQNMGQRHYLRRVGTSALKYLKLQQYLCACASMVCCAHLESPPVWEGATSFLQQPEAPQSPRRGLCTVVLGQNQPGFG